jgi:hypothetical protein
MNWMQIIGFSLITIGTIVSFIGSYYQSMKEDAFQNSLTQYVEKQVESEIPILKVLEFIGTDPANFKVKVKNIGKATASDVKLIINERSSPNIFSGTLLPGSSEIPQGVEVDLSLNLFSGINLVLSLPDENNQSKEFIKNKKLKFDNGEIVFIPRFHLEYLFNNKKQKSDDYYLVVNKKDGIIGLEKEEE